MFINEGLHQHYQPWLHIRPVDPNLWGWNLGIYTFLLSSQVIERHSKGLNGSVFGFGMIFPGINAILCPHHTLLGEHRF